MNYNVIFVTGPQGSGKGTQAKILARKLSFFYWEMGGVLRDNRDWKIGGQTIGSLIDKGTLLTDEQVLDVFKAKMKYLAADHGIIFDGIPRRIGQAEYLMKFLQDQGRKSFITLFLDVPREESIRRLLLRATVENRPDDTPEAIDFRLKQYEEETVPMLDYLKTCTLFLDVDGSPSIPEVERAVEDALQLQPQM